MNTKYNETEPVRYYSGPVDEVGAIVSVYGWYEANTWSGVKLVKKTVNGWLVKRVPLKVK